MKKPLPWIILLAVLAAVLLYTVAGSRPDAEGADSGPTPPHALVDD